MHRAMSLIVSRMKLLTLGSYFATSVFNSKLARVIRHDAIVEFKSMCLVTFFLQRFVVEHVVMSASH